MSRHAPDRAPLNRNGNRSESRGNRNPEAEEAGEKYALTPEQLDAAAALGISPRSAARIATHHARKQATHEPAALTRVAHARHGSVRVDATVGERVAAELARGGGR